jgi:hypothetical protein
MNDAFRLSRIRSPRGSLATMLLLAMVFIAFGLAVMGLGPDQTAAAPRYFDGTALTFANWLLGL